MRARGFSLMELMVVLAVIGLITAGVLIKFRGNSRDTELDTEAQRLDALFDYVREQAELQTRDYGFRVNETGYSFVVFDVLGNQWRPVDEDDALRERTLPPGLKSDLVVEGRKVVLTRKRTAKELDDFAPQVMIFANGDLSSFELALQREDSKDRARIYTDDDVNIRLLLPGEVEEKNPPVRTAAAK
jgi:general secretion pathway protein H